MAPERRVSMTEDGLSVETVLEGDGVPNFEREELDWLNEQDDPAFWATGVTTIMILTQGTFEEAVAAFREEL